MLGYTLQTTCGAKKEQSLCLSCARNRKQENGDHFVFPPINKRGECFAYYCKADYTEEANNGAND